MYDVARLAGVSHQTVSRVLNNHPSVSEPTRRRVQRAIEQLDYRPNQLARGLVTRRSGRLGVISLESQLFGPTSSLLGIERAAREAGYAVMVTVLDTAGASVRSAAAAMADQAVEGVLVIAPNEATAAGIRRLTPTVPTVAVEAGYGESVAVAAIDQLAGARQATNHLLALGHRTVWHIAGPADWTEAQGRVEGWRAALSESGAAAPPLLRGDWSPASGYRAALELAARAEVSAVFVANDQMALGLLSAFHQKGIRVPEDVSVVGFDDIPEAEFLVPALTTVHQDFDAVGRLAVQLLIDLINGVGHAQDARPQIVPRLTIRASTAAPPAATRRPGS
jgi:LacI family transcriptional regulator